MKLHMMIATGVAAMGFMSFAADAPMMSSSDKKFVMEAADGGMVEVELGKLAASKATDQKVKDFGQKMVDDHTKANNELKTVAQSKNVTLPAAVGAKNKALMDKLSAMSGASFDKAYVAAMVKDHKKDVADFQKEANGGKDTDVKGFASKTLPTLQEHLKMIQDIQSAQMGGGKMSADKKMD